MRRQTITKALLLTLVVACLAFVMQFKSQAFPLFEQISFTNRHDIFNQTQTLTTQEHAYQQQAQLVQFNYEPVLYISQTSNPSVFESLQSQEIFYPFQWKARAFNFEQTQEDMWFYSPDGQVIGFNLTIPRDTSGANLSKSEAQSIAEQSLLQSPVNIDLKRYHLIESKYQSNQHDRGDHEFIYELSNPSLDIHPGAFRVALNVTGDQLTSAIRYVKVPESFSRHYQVIRSTNLLLSQIGQIISFILILSSLIGIIINYRHQIHWRTIVYGATILSVLSTLSYANNLPFLYFYYPTQLSIETFGAQTISMILLTIVTTFLSTALAFLVGETFYRLAQPNALGIAHFIPAILKPNRETRKKIIAAYVWLAILFALQTAYFYLGQHIIFMVPSLNVDPNILATYIPWLPPLTQALMAGITEELIYRALPLSLAYLAGKRYGRSRLWMFCTIIVSSILFGLMHASYPIDPPFVRVIETGCVGLIFCAIYLRHGLLTAMLVHVLFDFILMSEPIIYTAGQINITIVITLTALPLLLTFISSQRTAKRHINDDSYQNKNLDVQIDHTDVVSHETIALIAQPALPRYTLAIGLILIAIGLITFPPNIVPGSWESKDTAKASLVASVESIDQSMSELAEHRIGYEYVNNYLLAYFWQQNLLDLALAKQVIDGPRWQLSIQETQGDENQRSEHILVSKHRWNHHIPSTYEGLSIKENEAKKIASDYLQQYHIALSDLISIRSIEMEKRTDWIVTFQSPTKTDDLDIRLLDQIGICGHVVCQHSKVIEIPEDLERPYQDQRSKMDIMSMVKSIANIAIGIGLGIYALIKRRQQSLTLKRYLSYTSGFLGLMSINMALDWHQLMFMMRNTVDPMNTITVPLTLGFSTLISAAIIGLLASISIHWSYDNSNKPSYWGEALLIMGIIFFTQQVGHIYTPPLWQDMSFHASYIPELKVILQPWVTAILYSIMALVAYDALTQITQHWQKNLYLSSAILFSIGFCLSPSTLSWQTSLIYGMLYGLTLLSVGIWMLSNQRRAIVPCVICGITALGLLQTSILTPIFGLSLFIVFSTGFIWSATIDKHAHQL